MPKVYESIRDSLISKGQSAKEAKTSAAKIFISKGKTKTQRSQRAKELHKG